MTARNEDFLFAQEAQNLGYVSEAQVEEGFLLQTRMTEELQIDERLAVILVKRGWLAEEQARRVYGIIEPEGARSQIEGYRLIQKVGRGAMGTVYKARHKGLNRIVAIKILRRDLAEDKTQIERLKREAKLLADLDHPNIVRAFDAGESNGFPYLVMEFVEGDTLRDKLARDGPMEDEEALRVTRALADALETARRMGIVHRDVKPGNILISKNGTPKLMDLGLAKGPIDAGLTQHGATVGTPQFMSPEQAESPEKADTRSDIYSLGATLYAMVTGRPPFTGTTLAEIITKVMSQQPVPPRVRNPDVSAEVSHLIERMMLKDASLRYATPALVVEDIDLIRGGQSIIPRGFQGNWEAYLLRKRFLKWRKRIVVGVAALLILGLGTWLWVDSHRKDIARTDMASLTDRLLLVEGVASDDTPEALDVRIRTLQAGHRQLEKKSDAANVPYSDSRAIRERIDTLQRAKKLLKRCADLDRELEPLRKAGDWAGALDRADEHASEMGHVVPAKACWQRLVKSLHEDSATGLRAALAQVEALPVADIDDFLSQYKARRSIYQRRWIPDGDYGEAQAAAAQTFEKARAIGVHLGEEFLVKFAPTRLESEIAAFAFHDQRKRFDDAARHLRASVAGQVRTWPGLAAERERVHALLLGEAGLITERIERVDRDMERRVEAAWQALYARLDALEPAEALRQLQAFFNDAARDSATGPLADLARAEHARRKNAVDRKVLDARIAFKRVRDLILQELRAGRPDRIRGAAKKELARDLLSETQRQDIEALVEGAAALEALHAGVLAWLQGRLDAGAKVTLRDVRFRDAMGKILTARTWVLESVDETRGILTYRMPRGDKRGVRHVPIARIALPTLRAWFAQGGSALSPLHQAILEVGASAAVERGPGVDLRPLIDHYRALQDRFGDTPPGPQWRRLLGEIVQELQDAQGARSDEAIGLTELIRRRLYFERRWKRLIELVDQMFDRDGRLRYTRAFDQHKTDLASKRREAEEDLARNELRRLFHGDVQPDTHDDGTTDILFNFDDVQQLKNFERGFAQWVAAGMLGGPAVTPGGAEGGRLHLLPGVKGLLRDRPLALLSMFDPAKAIEVEVKIHVLRGSSMLAFDLDGVQVAICSFDPALWKRRFLSGAPLGSDEDVLPKFDFYGMGRGIAFHAGPHFGSEFPFGNWAWDNHGQGRNFAELQKRAVIEKAKGRLFAFVPGGRSVTVRVVRDRNFMKVYVDTVLVIEGEDHRWAERGRHSPTDTRIRNGSGRIQVLSWSPLLIDDLRLRGTITEGWKQGRRDAIKAEAKKAKGAK